MNQLEMLTNSELQEHYSTLSHNYEKFQAQKLKLDMSRGKPCPAQLDLSTGLIDCLSQSDYKALDGTDCRNYGGLDGIPEAKELFAWILEARPQDIIIGGNSSLVLMHDLIARAMLHGLPGSEMPWGKLEKVKFLCPSPGYDRHFAICEYFGIEMITIDYQEDGPNMAQVEQLVAADSSIKGIWCVPKYSNPTGITYSDAVVKRLATMSTKATDFRIFWDNAYAVHHLTSTPDRLLNILETCNNAGHPDRVFLFSSTSKISLAGSGIAILASSETNITWLKKQMMFQTIGPDKLNQLRHVRFFRNQSGIEDHMRKQAAIITPKFNVVLEILESKLGGKNLASWSKPQGGYFISLNTLPGCAQKVVSRASAAGVVLTTFPSLAELKLAMELVALCVELVSAEQEVAKRNL
ncbi:MAG: putative aminotransferase/MSMEI [Firmicutes bacterium]|nr:putative aminotransferase/MSMEI [Bacillota bacterium]